MSRVGLALIAAGFALATAALQACILCYDCNCPDSYDRVIVAASDGDLVGGVMRFGFDGTLAIEYDNGPGNWTATYAWAPGDSGQP